MAANKFATILRRNSNKFTVILVYAVLEWMLIILLLLNSFFTFLILKFADYFGLKRPCIWCSRVDHILERRKNAILYRDLVCDLHAAEISSLSWCWDHKKLAESENMCEECLVSRKTCAGKLNEMNRKSEEEFRSCIAIVRCSCCDRYCLKDQKLFESENVCEEDCLATRKICDGKSIEMNRKSIEKFQSSCCDRCFGSELISPDLIIEAMDDNNNGGESESESAIPETHGGRNDDDEKTDGKGFVNRSWVDSIIECCLGEDDSIKIMDLRSQDRVIPVELIDSSTIENQRSHNRIKENLRIHDYGENESLEMSTAENELATMEVVTADGQDPEAATMEDSEDLPAIREELDRFKLLEDQNKFKNLMSTGETDNAAEAQESFTSLPCLEDQSSINHTATETFMVENNHGPKHIEKDNIQDNQLSMHTDQNEAEEEKFPGTPKREFGTESIDGSVVSEMESGDPFLTIERLKSSLKAEQKALSALYAELEEERNASAIAANQTMAMITRLQEEKAAMQMEALQYQRMMEEQSEYDQEALQLLNELVIKREKEKEELENELHMYRKQEIGLNSESKDEDEILNLEVMALDCVKHVNTIDESMEEYEEERMSILDQLKALEEKLSTLGDEQFFEEINSIQHFDENYEFNNGEQSRVSLAAMAKTLLPHLDATDIEVESTIQVDSTKAVIEEEVDNVYERLEALEAEREFLKHCMGSIKNGDKGRDLLQEILQHLRDLKTVEVRLRDINDDPIEC